jgi:hypothetical protein
VLTSRNKSSSVSSALTCSRSLEVFFIVGRKLVPIFRHCTAVPAIYCEIHCPDKINFAILINWHRLTLIPDQSHTPSRLACGKGIGLPGFDVQRFSRGKDTGLIWINPGGYDVLACRQIATVVSALREASYILAID